MQTISKSLLCFLIFTTIIQSANAQVGINNDNPRASLDISKTSILASDGILIPRMSSQDLIQRHGANLYGSDQNSILVYINDITGADTDTKTDKITKIGFYYYNSTEDKWLSIIPDDTEGIWYQIGTTTASKSNTNNSYLKAKVSIGGNYISSVNGGTDNAQLSILGEDISVRGVTIGAGAGGDSTNTVVGRNALMSNTKGTYNVALGTGALQATTTNWGNVAIGAGSSAATTANGISSMGLGSSAGSDYSTAIGASSTIAESSTSSTALGYYSTIDGKSAGSVAVGEGAKIAENSPTAIAIGKQAIASAENAIAIGFGANNNQKDAAFIKSRTSTIGNAIGTSNVTLEIVGENAVDSKADGILIPKVTIGQLNAKEGQYAEPQFGTMVFVNFIGDGTATGKTQDVVSYGFYYYDYWNGRGARWTKLNDVAIRSSIVEVGSDKYYKTLQTAYNEEAKKLYNQNGSPVEFVCSGEVGGLDTDGSIPFIRIKSDGTMTSNDKGLTFNSTIAHLDGKIDLTENSLTAYSSDIVILVNAEIQASQLSVDNSTFKAFFGGNQFTFDAITCFNSFVDIEGGSTASSLNLVGNPNVGYLVSSTNRSYILFANNLTITCNSTDKQNCSFTANKSSSIYCNAVTQISFNGTYTPNVTSSDIYASTIGNVIFDECHNIGGSSKPTSVIIATHKSNVISYQSIINKGTAQNGVSLVSGSSFSVIGANSSITLKGSDTTGSIGISSSGSNAALSYISASNPMVILEGFKTGLQATEGGTINAMNRIQRTTGIAQPNIPITIGTPSKTGAVIYDSDTEE